MNTGNVGGGFKAAKKLGNKKQFSDFTEFCGTNKISLFMNFDIVRFKQSGSGFFCGKGHGKAAQRTNSLSLHL